MFDFHRLIAAILLFAFSSSISGVIINAHTCCGKVKNWALYQEAKSCKKSPDVLLCEEPDMPVHFKKTSCCGHEQTTFLMEYERSQSQPITSAISYLTVALFFYRHVIIPTHTFNGHLNKPPPDLNKTICTFLAKIQVFII